MNVGTKIRTALAVLTSVNTALMAVDLTGFNNATLDTIYKVASIVLNFFIVALVTYMNNDYTKEAAGYTGEMRLMKEQKKGIITGENFVEEPEFNPDEEFTDEEIW